LHALKKTQLVFDRPIPPTVIVQLVGQLEVIEALLEIFPAGTGQALQIAVGIDVVNTVFFKNIGQCLEVIRLQ
jgi:hypothetical protein